MELLAKSTIPIALDEELIGVRSVSEKVELLDKKPQYIILKPSLLGGFKETSEWIKLATEKGVGWWLTSALESTLGLMAIAQFISRYSFQIPQGLGTGQIYTNNIAGPLLIRRGKLVNLPNREWKINFSTVK